MHRYLARIYFWGTVVFVIVLWLSWATRPKAEVVLATYYHEDKITCTGAAFKPNALAFAHRTAPMWSWWIFVYGKKQIIAQKTDCGPCAEGGPCSKNPAMKAHVQKVQVDMTPAMKRALDFPDKGYVLMVPLPPIPKAKPRQLLTTIAWQP